MNFTVERTIKVPCLDEARLFKIEHFWCDRGIDFSEFTLTTFKGSRGGPVQNLFAIESTRLWSELAIHFMRSSSSLSCRLKANTVFHDMTDWDRAFLNLEMATFESFLLHDDRKVGLWNDFMDQYRAAMKRWAVTFGMSGRRLPESLHKRIERELN